MASVPKSKARFSLFIGWPLEGLRYTSPRHQEGGSSGPFAKKAVRRNGSARFLKGYRCNKRVEATTLLSFAPERRSHCISIIW